MKNLSPKQIIKELNRYIISQGDAKKAVAVALRNRWRRQNVKDDKLRDEILPKNILMIGPTGVGKTEIARRLAKLANAPFIKVEATKFTEVGYVGRDVESIVRDLMDIAVIETKEKMKKEFTKKAYDTAISRIVSILVGAEATDETRDKFREKVEKGELDDKEIEVKVTDHGKNSSIVDIPGMPGAQVGMFSLSDIIGDLGKKTKTKKLKVKDAVSALRAEEENKMIDEDSAINFARDAVENNGIVFIDEIDKICTGYDDKGRRGEVSREGVQRDLLPLIEGTTVNTKYGPIKTEHILFITSGAFHLTSPSDLLPELQGRLPIRVDLKPLSAEDFVSILTETEANLIDQNKALLATEGLDLEFAYDALEEIAKMAESINKYVENIGARRLHTILEKILEDISFDSFNCKGEKVFITKEMVRDKIEPLTKSEDLSKFIL
jgi:ATP-dependent HslUV protease ATP-binding subunit HslU